MLDALGDKTRRNFLAIIPGAVAAITLLPSTVSAADADVKAEIKKLYGDKALKEGKIKIDLPSIAENGLVVPLGFEVESPMTEADFVKSIHFFAEGNPNPLVASFHFTPLAPKAAAGIRIRLAQTQKVIAIAEMSSGEIYTAAREVKVTIGGCGG